MRTAAWLLVVLVIVAACGHRADPAPGPAGTLTGVAAAPGGPAGASAGPLTVVVTRDGSEAARQTVGDGDRFVITVAPGTYRLSVAGDDGAVCTPAGDVTVAAGQRGQRDLTCQRK